MITNECLYNCTSNSNKFNPKWLLQKKTEILYLTRMNKGNQGMRIGFSQPYVSIVCYAQ